MNTRKRVKLKLEKAVQSYWNFFKIFAVDQFLTDDECYFLEKPKGYIQFTGKQKYSDYESKK